ncbi:beta-ketoacyl-[acyl-carrier-protein] synthase family protein [Leucobacter allii]|nr:beta-ketoacyl-[acyl-carrier-protein] synthase family protein [Leucobacter allii]UOR03402.1 beta-ketoacyl-[acyl-carrier-protein] synthase family protein [Leucobacter allii]
MGAVTASGIGAPALWDAVVAGRSAITALDGTAFAELPVRIGGRVRDFDASRVLTPAQARRLSPVVHWAIAAADEALGDALGTARGGATAAVAGPPFALPWSPRRTAVIVATGSGPVDAMQAATRALDARGPRAVPLALAMHGAPDAAAALISQRHGLHGPAQAVSATCASGGVGLGEGLRRIRHGYADAVLVVGAEDCLGPVNLAANANLRALATGYEAHPEAACRPFDRGRGGFVMSQGAAAILLESASAARARGAVVLAELAGFGASSDAHHATAPEPGGRGAAEAVAEALADAGIDAAAAGADAAAGAAAGAGAAVGIDAINAHGTGTPAGDAAELAAFARVFGDAARRIPISATKSVTGHLLGASGVAEAIIAVQSLRTGMLPPTRNLDDPEFPEWDIVAGAARRSPIRTALSTSFGFGGHNAALVLRRADPANGLS